MKVKALSEEEPAEHCEGRGQVGQLAPSLRLPPEGG